MSGFKSYKIRDGVHIPSKKYKEGWDAIFSDKKKLTKGDTMNKIQKQIDDIENRYPHLHIDLHRDQFDPLDVAKLSKLYKKLNKDNKD